MNSIDAITQKIIDEANESARQRENEGKQAAEVVLSDFEKQAEQESQAILDRAEAQAGAIPVSYPHLDVYKRQGREGPL